MGMEQRSSKTLQALWLVTGNLCSLLFGLGSMAVLGRYLTTEQYGTYRQVLYVYQTLLILFSLGMPRAYSYFLVRMPVEEGRSFVAKMRRMFLGLGAGFAVLLYAGAGGVAQVLENPALAPRCASSRLPRCCSCPCWASSRCWSRSTVRGSTRSTCCSTA